jgi:hypothetical protein
MSRILKRPMFRRGGPTNTGIMSSLVDRKNYKKDGFVTTAGQTASQLTPELESILEKYTPKPRFGYGEVGLGLASGLSLTEALSAPYKRFTTADDAREAAIKGGAAKLAIAQALKDKKTFRQLTDLEKKARGLPLDKQFQIDANNKVTQIGGSGTNVSVITPPPETQEEKDIGKVYGEEFGEIVKAGNLAIINDQKLEILKAINESPDLKTGKFGEFRTEVQKLAETFGFDPNLQDTTSAEIVTGISGGLVLDGLQKFSGAISDGERNFTKSITAGLSMTKEGNRYLLQIANRQNELAKGFSEFANSWVQENGGLSKRSSDGMTWGQAKAKWHEENPLINPEMKESLEKLSKQVDTEFQTNIFTVDGKSYVYHYGVDGKKGFYTELK